MRILHAIPVYAPAWQFGGPVQSVSRLCEQLACADIEVSVITTNAGIPELNRSQLGELMSFRGVNVRYFETDRQSGPIHSRAMVDALPDVIGQYDLVHLSTIWQPLGLPIQRVAKELGVPILQTPRGALGRYSFRQKWWKKYPYYFLRELPLLENAAGIHVTSHMELQEIQNLGITRPCWILPNPIDLSSLRMDDRVRDLMRKSLGISQDEILFLICGRQHHKKGLDLLPDVFNAIRSRPWKVLLVGNDDDGSGSSFVSELKKLGLCDRLIQRKAVPPGLLAEIYNAADLLLMPSRHENFGNVAIEALGCGCAIAVSDVTGVATDLVKEAPKSFGAVLPRRRDAWICWLDKWLSSPQRGGASVSNWVGLRYGQASVAAKAIEIYKEILGNH